MRDHFIMTGGRIPEPKPVFVFCLAASGAPAGAFSAGGAGWLLGRCQDSHVLFVSGLWAALGGTMGLAIGASLATTEAYRLRLLLSAIYSLALVHGILGVCSLM
jgi:hypothetical protein